jgi:hypothetical protein
MCSGATFLDDHVLHFVPIANDAPILVFHCDEKGRVDIDALSPHEREEYLYARAMIGRQYWRPRCVAPHPEPTESI